MASVLAIAYLKQLKSLSTLLKSTCLFLDAIIAVDAGFNFCIHEVRGQTGQKIISKMLQEMRMPSSFVDTQNTQNDYCVRCMP